MNRNARKDIAKETLEILKDGYYYVEGKKIDIADVHKFSLENSFLIRPEEAKSIAEKYKNSSDKHECKVKVVNQATVQSVLELCNKGFKNIGVLNFASAKNPGGGFLNGALAQEESIAIGTGLYETQLKNEGYYLANRAFRSMMYTDNMIYSKDVVFIRDESLALLEKPQTASILTSPAVNYGQVLLKKEDGIKAQKVMKDRMRMILSVFAQQEDKNLVLGAYGCGVFRNDPKVIGEYWRALLYDENYISYFDNIVFAVFDKSKNKECIRAFEEIF